jgi:hypothetical protein
MADKMLDPFEQINQQIPEPSIGCGQAMPGVEIGKNYKYDPMKDLLTRAKHEIVGLRRSNEVLSAQIDVVNIFAAALGMKRNVCGACEDVAWLLERKINELDNSAN